MEDPTDTRPAVLVAASDARLKEELLSLLSPYLRELRVSSASSLAEALMLCEREPPALAIVDELLGEGEGIVFATKLAVAVQDAQIVLLTSSRAPSPTESARVCRRLQWLAKPVQADTFVQRLRAILPLRIEEGALLVPLASEYSKEQQCDPCGQVLQLQRELRELCFSLQNCAQDAAAVVALCESSLEQLVEQGFLLAHSLGQSNPLSRDERPLGGE